jgi:hypothetical protein
MEAGALEGTEAPDCDRNALIRPSNCRSPATGDPAPPSRDTGRFSQTPKTAPNKSEARAIVIGRIRDGFISGY